VAFEATSLGSVLAGRLCSLPVAGGRCRRRSRPMPGKFSARLRGIVAGAVDPDAPIRAEFRYDPSHP